MNPRQRTLFPQAMQRAVRKATGETLNELQCFELCVSENNKSNLQLWSLISNYLDVSDKAVHDYFHNTYSKKFCEPIGPYKQVVQQLAERIARTYFDRKVLMNKLKDELKVQFPDLRFHYQELYSLVKRITQKLDEQLKQTSKEQTGLEENNFHQQMRPLVEQQIRLEKDDLQLLDSIQSMLKEFM